MSQDSCGELPLLSGKKLTGVYARLQEKQGALTRSERLVAEWLERSVERIAFLTVSEVSLETGVSEATVVRFARKLDFDSFSAMQREVQVAVQRQYSLGDKLQQALKDEEQGPLARAYRRDLENLRRTYEHVDETVFDAAVKAIARAPRVAVIGLRASAGAAVYTAFALNLVRPRVLQLRQDLDNTHDQLLDMGPGDVLIAIALAKPARRTLEAVHEAKQRYGASVVGITSSSVSALAQMADHVLVAAGEGTFNSYAATFSLAGALLDGVATTLRDSATARLRRLDAINSEDVYAQR